MANIHAGGLGNNENQESQGFVIFGYIWFDSTAINILDYLLSSGGRSMKATMGTILKPEFLGQVVVLMLDSDLGIRFL